jgi:Xaa-Pro aminopeptidase
MKEDLDRYLEEAGLDGLIVIGAAARNPSMTYFTGVVHVGSGILVRRRNSPAVLYCSDMERDEVARAGLRHSLLDGAAFARQAGGDPQEAEAIAFERVLRENNLVGRIQVHGQSEVGDAIETFRRLAGRLPGLETVGLRDSASPLARARATKDSVEVDRIRRMGAITVEVIDRVADFLTSHQARQGILVDRHGKRSPSASSSGASTYGWRSAARKIRRERSSPSVTMPGSRTAPASTISRCRPACRSSSISFPASAAEATSMTSPAPGAWTTPRMTRPRCTRTCWKPIGWAWRRLGLEPSGRELQRAVCELFEGRGHPSGLSTPGTRAGYVHSLGHGVGLAIHEAPWLSMPLEPPDLLQPGHVVTIEPGLYYPERGLGVRLEDTVWIGREGPEVLAPYPMDLVLPMRRSQRGQASKPSRSKKTKPRRARPAGRAG